MVSARITLGWSAPGDDGYLGEASVYDLRYAKVPITDENWDSDFTTRVSVERTPKPPFTQETFLVSGLDHDTYYWFAIKAGDEVPNWSPLSNVYKVKTEDVVRPGRISDLDIISDEPGEVLIRWTASGDNDEEGRAAKYQIIYTKDSAGTWTMITPEIEPADPGTAERYRLTGLFNGVKYWVAIRALDEDYNASVWSDVGSIVVKKEQNTHDGPVPEHFNLAQNRPNPFNPVTVIDYDLAQPGFIKLVIFNLLGQRVKSLANTYQEAGSYSIGWDGRDENGRIVASGIYFYRLETPYYSSTRKMVFLK